jgi:hypothetical protein
MSKAAGRAARDAALGHVEAAADPAWLKAAVAAVRNLAMTTPEFTSDDVWRTLGSKPLEARALGPVFLRAARAKLIEKTDRTRQTAQVSRHATDIRIWRSLVCGQRQVRTF